MKTTHRLHVIVGLFVVAFFILFFHFDQRRFGQWPMVFTLTLTLTLRSILEEQLELNGCMYVCMYIYIYHKLN